MNIEPNINLKIDKGLPLSSAEFGRTVRVLVAALNALTAKLTTIQGELDELKASVSRSRLDSNPKGMDKSSNVRPKSDE